MTSAETSPQEYRGPMSPSLVHDKANHVLKTLGQEYIAPSTEGDMRCRQLIIHPILQLNGDPAKIIRLFSWEKLDDFSTDPAKIIRLFSWEKLDDFSTDPAKILIHTFEPISDINTRHTKQLSIKNKNGTIETKPFKVAELIRLSPDGPTIKAEQVWHPYSEGTEISAAKLRKVDELLSYMHTYVSAAHELKNKNNTPER